MATSNSTNVNANETFFYAIFDKPDVMALNAFKTALGAQEIKLPDGGTALHTDKAFYAKFGPKGSVQVPGWRMNSEVLGRAPLEHYFKNVKYFVSKEDLLAGKALTLDAIKNTKLQSYGDVQKKAATEHVKKAPDFMEKIKTFKNDPIHKGPLITPVVVMEYAAAKAKFFAGLIGKTPFSGDINKAVDSDAFLNSGLKTTAASGLDMGAIKEQIKYAAKTYKAKRFDANSEYIRGEQNEANKKKFQRKLWDLTRHCGLMAIKPFPENVQQESADFKRQAEIDAMIEDRKTQAAKPSDASLAADAFLSGKAPTFSKSAFKSHISKLYWQLCRAPENANSMIMTDKMLQAHKEAYEDLELFAKRGQILEGLAGEVAKTVTALKSLDPSVPNFKQTEFSTIRKGFYALGSIIGNVHEDEVEKKLENEQSRKFSNEPKIYVRIDKEDLQNRQAIKDLGGHWNKDLVAWSLPEKKASQLDLGGKGQIFNNLDDLKAGKALGAANVQKSIKQESEETLSGGMSM